MLMNNKNKKRSQTPESSIKRDYASYKRVRSMLRLKDYAHKFYAASVKAMRLIKECLRYCTKIDKEHAIEGKID